MADSKDITLKIDDRDVTVPPGTLVIEAARRMGIEVPSFCYYPGLSLQAACRMCLVEVEKAPKMQTACTLAAMPGMVVRTGTEQVRQARKAMLEFLLANPTAPTRAGSPKKNATSPNRNGLRRSTTTRPAASCVSGAFAFVTKEWTSRRSASGSAARNR